MVTAHTVRIGHHVRESESALLSDHRFTVVKLIFVHSSHRIIICIDAGVINISVHRQTCPWQDLSMSVADFGFWLSYVHDLSYIFKNKFLFFYDLGDSLSEETKIKQ